VANHSGIGNSDDTAIDSDILRRVDYAVDRDEFIQVVDTGNGDGTNQPPPNTGYNVTLHLNIRCTRIPTCASSSKICPNCAKEKATCSQSHRSRYQTCWPHTKAIYSNSSLMLRRSIRASISKQEMRDEY